MLKLFLLGVPKIEFNGQSVTFASRKATALLAYLAINARPCHRSELATLFWPESDSKRAKGALRYTLSLLRKELDQSYLRIERNEVEFRRNEQVFVDVWRFETHTTAIVPEQPIDEQLSHLTNAADLFGGDFLSGFSLRDCPAFDEWVFFEAARLRQLYADVLHKLVGLLITQGQFATAVPYAQRRVKLDSYDEPAQRELIYIYGRCGNWAAAQRQYQLCLQQLQDELGVEPESKTIELGQQIQNRQLAIPKDQSPTTTAPQIVSQTNLPQIETDLLGRQSLLMTLNRNILTDNVRLLSLIGPGGIGKTRLALALAYELESDFVDGVFFVDLTATRRPSDMASTLIEALQLPVYEGQSPQKQLLIFLQKRHILLVLDNVEHLLNDPDATAVFLIQKLLQESTHLQMIVTSRERLRLQTEKSVLVPELDYVHEAVNTLTVAALLFKSRAEQVTQPLEEEDVPLIKRICELTQGIPLAIELAAALTAGLSLADIVAQIESSFDILATDLYDINSRHQSLRAVFNSSWNTLAQAEKQILAKLSLFQGGFTLEAAHAVAQANPATLGNLVHKSLIRIRGNGRYDIHNVLKFYASEKLQEQPETEEQTHHHHTQYFMGYLNLHMRDWLNSYETTSLTRLEYELDNIRAAWQRHLQQGDTAATIQFLDNLWQYYKTRGRFSEAIFVLKQTLNNLQSHTNQIVTRANCERRLGDAYFNLGQARESQQHLTRAIQLLGESLPPANISRQLLKQIVRQLNNRIRPLHHAVKATGNGRIVAAKAYDRLAQLYYLADELPPSAYVVLRGLNLAEMGQALPTLAIMYADMCVLCGALRRNRWAQRYGQLAQQTAQKFKDIPVLAAVSLREGIYLNSIGQWTQARQKTDIALKLYRWVEDWRNVGDCLSSIGANALLQGQLKESLKIGAELELVSQKSNNIEHQAWAAFGQAVALLYLGQYQKTLFLLEKTEWLLDVISSKPMGGLNFYGTSALTHLRLRHKEEAHHAAAKASSYYEEKATTVFFITVLGYSNLAEYYLASWREALNESTDPTEYELQTRRIVDILKQYARYHTISRPFLDLYQGDLYWLLGKQRKARRFWTRCLQEAQNLKMVYLNGQALLKLGMSYPASDPRHKEYLQNGEKIISHIQGRYVPFSESDTRH